MLEFNFTEEELSRTRESMLEYFWGEICIRKLKEELCESTLEFRVKSLFEKFFSYDSQGLPRIWTVHYDMDTLFKDAVSNALEALFLFSKLSFNSPRKDLYPSNIIKGDCNVLVVEHVFLADIRLLKLKTSVEKKMQSIFIDAKRSVLSNSSRIPPWILILLLILGWNELKLILSSPILLIGVLLLGSVFYFLYSVNLLPVVVDYIVRIFHEGKRSVIQGLKIILDDSGRAPGPHP